MLNKKTFRGKESHHKIVSKSSVVSERVINNEFQFSDIYDDPVYKVFISNL